MAVKLRADVIPAGLYAAADAAGIH
jgi:hypothetical protein